MDYEMAVPREVSAFHAFVTDIYIKQSNHVHKAVTLLPQSQHGISAPMSILHQLYISVFKNKAAFFCLQK